MSRGYKSFRILFIVTLFFCSNIFLEAFALKLPQHPNSTLIKQEFNQDKSQVFEYRSRLSQEQIFQFYREMLSYQGWQIEETAAQIGGMNVFKKGEQSLILNFPPSAERGITLYRLTLVERPQAELPLVGSEEYKKEEERFKIQEPQKLDFMPIYPGAKQITYNKSADRIWVMHLASGTYEAIRDFYLKEMPALGWKLLKNKEEEVQSSCSSCAKASLGEKASQEKPKMTSLEFAKETKKCFLYIYPKQDSAEAEEKYKKASTTQKLGDIIINVNYHESK
jgi:hypothetical protein